MGVNIIRKDSVRDMRMRALGVTPPGDWNDVTQVRQAKRQEIGLACSAAIYAGVDVGELHYSLTEHDQLEIKAQYDTVKEGAAVVPYHADGELCRMYPAEEFAAVAQAATAHVFYHRTYCNENIKAVYHELFGEALKRYNGRQTRADRKIEDYYEKIRSSKQEKPFHEIILQIGNKDDMSADSEEGQLAAAVLDEYMRGFQERNPQLRVFPAHLHMDEATPHLRIDFVPFTTGSKRGAGHKGITETGACHAGL